MTICDGQSRPPRITTQLLCVRCWPLSCTSTLWITAQVADAVVGADGAAYAGVGAVYAGAVYAGAADADCLTRYTGLSDASATDISQASNLND